MGDNSLEFAREALAQLLRLYQLALLLPLVAPEGYGRPKRFEHEEWDAMKTTIARRLPADFYWEVFAPLPLDQESVEPVVGSLSDDLADVWGDIKPGLIAMERNSEVSGDFIVWGWRWTFEHHWGEHAVRAMNVLHSLCFGKLAAS